ncbi:MAG TPA: helix-turn-helix transcriptional regulator [Acidobacteriota bacterium]|nr:helix-turn-helix transcriptional regulator [Acidobacteriota bacterium]
MSGEELKVIRKRMGLKEAMMAKILGQSLQTYRRWESGKAKIPIPTMLRLALEAIEAHVQTTGTFTPERTILKKRGHPRKK